MDKARQYIKRYFRMFAKLWFVLTNKPFLLIDRAIKVNYDLLVTGFAISKEAIEKVEVYGSGNNLLGVAEYGFDRPDIDHFLGETGEYRNCGFKFFINSDITDSIKCKAISKNKKSITSKVKIKLDSDYKPLDRFIEKVKSLEMKFDLRIDHSLGGGSNDFRLNEIANRIENGIPCILISYLYFDYIYSISFYSKDEVITSAFVDIGDIKSFLIELDIKKIFVHNLVSFRDTFSVLDILMSIKTKKQVNIMYFVHDYYSVCPSSHLLDSQGKYCGVPDFRICNICMEGINYEHILIKENRKQWHEKWSEFFDRVNEIVCFSNSSKSIIQRAYGGSISNKVVFRKRSVEKIPEVVCKNQKSSIRIGILGTLTYIKGSQIINDLYSLIKDEKRVSMIVIGGIKQNSGNLRKVERTGRYDKSKLSDILTREQIDCIFIPSIVPETFSNTIHEAIQTGLPVACFNLGAQAEAVIKYDKGIVIDEINARKALSAIVDKVTEMRNMIPGTRKDNS